jgi:hypothetical protein
MTETYNTEDAAHWAATLPVLRQLSSEIAAGNRALARDDYKGFEKSVATQGELCNLLIQTKLFTVPASDEGAAGRVPAKPAKSPVPEAIQRVLGDLAQQKRLYCALLERAKRYTRILLSVCRSQRGYLPDGSVPVEGSTWSSEV